MKNSRRNFYFAVAALLCRIAALVLEILPYGIVMIFSSGPDKKIRETYSYFSLMPFGYGNFCALPAGILTLAAVGVGVVSFLRKMQIPKLRRMAFRLGIVAAVFSVLSLLLSFSLGEGNGIGVFVSALLVVSAVLGA